VHPRASRIMRPRPTAWWLAGLLAILALSPLGAADSLLARSQRAPEPADSAALRAAAAESSGTGAAGEQQLIRARAVFETVAIAWEAADHATLAELVAPEGVRIAVMPRPERENQYSPSQAFYFFKNLFRSTRTDTFSFRRIQQEAEGGVVHAVADWSYRRAGADVLVQDRLFFTLTEGRSGWGLSEIRAVR
jgi:hypothetical protein